MQLIMDPRWNGPHGIGRFGREVLARISHTPLEMKGKPLDLLDPVRLNRHLKRQPQAVFFSPGFNPPAGRPCPFFFTLHDLIHLDSKEESGPLKRLWYEIVVRPALERSEGIFTVSEFSKGRILDWSGMDPDKITVVGNGVGPEFTPEGPRWDKARRPYFLYVGNHKPHKNSQGLVEAFSRSGLSRDFDLVLTGQPNPAMTRCLAHLPEGNALRFLGKIEDFELAALYRSAQSLILPSWIEGFGLPLIEAMASGTPVISSNRTALPEIGGDAALYFDPSEPESLVAALHRFQDPEQSQPYRRLGIERARLFRWEQVSARIQKRLQKALPPA